MFSFFKKKKDKSADEKLAAVIEELVNSNESKDIDEDQVEPLSVSETIDKNLEPTKKEIVEGSANLEHTPLTSEKIVSISSIEQPAVIEQINSITDLDVANLDTNDTKGTAVADDDQIIEENESKTIVDDEEKLQPQRKLSWAARLKQGLSKTRDALGKKLLGVFGGGQIDDDLYDDLESILLTSDVGIAATTHLLDDVRKKVSLRGLKDGSELKKALTDSLSEMLLPIEKPLVTGGHTPFVIMMVGVNGAGKTTSIGKLAKYFQQQDKSVMLAAGDTFRAAAREQLIEWGKRNNVTVVAQQSGDSAAVCYDAIQSAISKKIDIVLADTAGRLPTQLNLMTEIQKVKRVINKALPDAPHEIMLVLDANIGQNAMNQVKAFDDALGLTGLVLTKLDGTAKGGVICAIAKEHPVPLRFIGVGESIDDLRPFIAKDYVEALLD